MSCLVFLFLILLTAKAQALSPQRVLVVANKKSPVSQEVARYYQKKRLIPTKNLLFLPLPRREEITRPIYLEKLERPIASYLRENQLQDQILAIVLMPEVPHKIRGRVARDGDAAAVDSELTLLYRKMLYGPYRLSGWLENPYFKAPLGRTFEHDLYDIYLVTRISAYTKEEALALIDRALEAPQSKPPYRLVLDARGDPTQPGDNWLKATYLLLKDFPGLVFTLSFSPSFVRSADRVIGYASWGSNDPRYPKDRRLDLHFLPGAIGVTYVSTNARTFHEPPSSWRVGASWREKQKHFAGSPQSLIGDLIRQGITGVSGNVYEPYLAASARPYLLFPAYLSGSTLAEAYYRALAYLSWQTVVVGDPLASLKPSISKETTPKDWFFRRQRAYLEAKKGRGPKDRIYLAQIDLLLGLSAKALEEIKPLLSGRISEGVLKILSQIVKEPDLRKRIRRLLSGHRDPKVRLFLAFLALDDGDLREARNLLHPFLQNPSPPLEARMIEGLLALREGHCQEAISSLEEVLARRPGRWSLFVPFYQALKQCGYEERAAHIRAAILNRPEFAELWPAFKDQ